MKFLKKNYKTQKKKLKTQKKKLSYIKIGIQAHRINKEAEKDNLIRSQNTNFKRANIHLVTRAQKQAFAKDSDGEPNVLIDDYIKNIKEWEAKGGIGIHHTAVSQTLNELKRLGFK